MSNVDKPRTTFNKVNLNKKWCGVKKSSQDKNLRAGAAGGIRTQ